jgi:hypothetical protein
MLIEPKTDEISAEDILDAAELSEKSKDADELVRSLENNGLSVPKLARYARNMIEDGNVNDTVRVRLIELSYRLHGALSDRRDLDVIPQVVINIQQNGEKNLLNLLAPTQG